MRPLMTILALLVCLAAVAPAAEAVDTPALTTAELPGDFMGMVVRDPHYEWQTNASYPGVNEAFYETMGLYLQQAGVKWVRIEFFAEETGPLAGSVDTAKYSYFVNTVAPKYGFKVIGLLATPLVRNTSGQYLDPELIEAGLSNSTCAPNGNAYGFTNQYMCIWLNNAFKVAKAFPYNPATGAGVAAYEVLNEENRYLNGGGKGLAPTAVATLLTKFYRVFKSGGPDGSLGAWRNDVAILLGGLHPDRCDDCAAGGFNDRQYLDAIYKSGAFQSYRQTNSGRNPLDGVGYHPYPMEMRSGLVPEPTGAVDLFRIPQRIRQIRQVMVNNGDTNNKIWITEIGDRGAPADLDNQQRQAEFMHSVYWMLWQQREYIQTVLWFKYEDFAVPADPSATGPENWGVVRLTPRPANQPCPQQLPPERQTCEYEQTGVVQTFKQSYTAFKAMATTGEGLQTYQTFLPVLP